MWPICVELNKNTFEMICFRSGLADIGLPQSELKSMNNAFRISSTLQSVFFFQVTAAGVTGDISFDADGLRKDYKLEVVDSTSDRGLARVWLLQIIITSNSSNSNSRHRCHSSTTSSSSSIAAAAAAAATTTVAVVVVVRQPPPPPPPRSKL